MYYVYILRCCDGSLYSGIATDPKRRFRQHAGELSGGAKYTAFHPPLRFEAIWSAPDRAIASKLEYRLKRLTHAQKERLISGSAAESIEPEGCKRADLQDFI